jgi:tetratricopeptide (TPR) repeat protein/predicted Ser/Thr protein kinase
VTDSSSVDTPTEATASGDLVEARPAAAVAVGERLGERYVVTAFLGEGGMGAVYRAHDEKLGEDVALKIVRDTARGNALRDETRLAQKVTHPNVCRTYDLEEVAGHQLVKMEYVAGQTLLARLAASGKLAIDEAVRIARAIAEGLAAAHEQGIVHRDLKPANVMLSGERVVLMDFGIARRIASETGKTAGTIGYMAPEQIANFRIDGRADLYSLGCVLYEMLAGERVFGAARGQIELAVHHVSVPAPDVREVRAETPRWLARAVAYLLAKEPAARTLGAARLRAGPRRLRRFALPAAAFVLAAVGAGLTWSSRSVVAPCAGIEQRLAGVWDPAIRAAVHTAFAKTGKSFAEASFSGLAQALDDYSAGWTAAVTDSCRATRVRGEQTEDVMALREECFDERLAELRALSRLLGDADVKLVEKGNAVVTELPPIDGCSNVAMLRAPGLPPIGLEAPAHQLAMDVAASHAELIAAHSLPALVASQGAVERARALHWEPALASAYDVRCHALAASGNIPDALDACKEATWAGMRGKRDDILANGALSVALLLAETKPQDAEVWVDLGNAAAIRAGLGPQLDTRRYAIAAEVAADRGDLNTAVALFDKAYVAATRAFGSKDALQLMWIETDFASTLSKAGACGLAVPHYEHALLLTNRNFGPDYPEIARLWSNVGLCYRHVGELAKAHDALSRALAMREQQFGKQHPYLVASLDNYAELLAEEGDRVTAFALMERAKTIAAVVPGTAHPVYHQVVTDYAQLLVDAGRLADARAAIDQVLELERAAGSAVLPKTLTVRASLALAEHHWAEAAQLAEQAIAGFEAQGGKDQPELWQPLAYLASAKLQQHDRETARTVLQRAIAVADKAHIPEHDLAATRALVAEANK